MAALHLEIFFLTTIGKENSLSQKTFFNMAGRLLASFCLGFLLLTQSYASPIPQSSTSTPGSSGAGQAVTPTSGGATSGGTTSGGVTSGGATSGGATSGGTASGGTTSGGMTGATSEDDSPDSTTSDGSAGGTQNSAPSSGYTTAEASSTPAGTTSQAPSSGTTSEASSTPADTTGSNTASTGDSSTCEGGSYNVLDRETCETIAEKNSVSTLLLMKANGITDECRSLKKGDALCLPKPCYPYKVKTGDTCGKITEALNSMLAQKNVKKQVTVELFQAWNQ